MEFQGANYGSFYEDDPPGLHQNDAAGAFRLNCVPGGFANQFVPNPSIADKFSSTSASHQDQLQFWNNNLQAYPLNSPLIGQNISTCYPLQTANSLTIHERLAKSDNYSSAASDYLDFPVQQDHFGPQRSNRRPGDQVTQYPYGYLGNPSHIINANLTGYDLEPPSICVPLGQDNLPPQSSGSHSIPGGYDPSIFIASGSSHGDDENNSQTRLSILASVSILHGHPSAPGQSEVSMEAEKPQSGPSIESVDTTHHNGLPVSVKAQGQGSKFSAKPRIPCDKCAKTFTRRGDMLRHLQKHDAEKRQSLCGVKDCKYKGSYRMDKVYSHVKNCHSPSDKSLGAITSYGPLTSLGLDLYRDAYCFPACGGCLFSRDFLESEAFLHGKFEWPKGDIYHKKLDRIMSEDCMGLKRLTRSDLEALKRYR